jgi:hypothetical protein
LIEGVFLNMERSVERRRALEAQLDAIDLPYPVHRFPAIDGRQRPECPAGLSPGQYGCWLSHLQALRQIGPGGEHVHVMEDDALLSSALPAMHDLLGAVEAGSSGDWDILYLDATLVEVADMIRVFEWTQAARVKGTVHIHRLPRESTVYGAHAYVINGRSKARVIEFLASQLALPIPYDNGLANGIQQGSLRAYITTPFVSSGSEEGLIRTIGDGNDEKFLAWLLFRRLCFWDLPDEEVDALAGRLRGLQGVGSHEAILGQLIAFRTTRWPGHYFPPVPKI